MTVNIELKLFADAKTGKYAAECPMKCGWDTTAMLKKECLDRVVAHMNAQHREGNKVGNA